MPFSMGVYKQSYSNVTVKGLLTKGKEYFVRGFGRWASKAQ